MKECVDEGLTIEGTRTTLTERIRRSESLTRTFDILCKNSLKMPIHVGEMGSLYEVG